MDSLGFGLTFVLKDQFSKVAMRIQDQFNKLESSADKFAKSVENAKKRISSGFETMAIGATITAPLIASVKVASDLSDSLAKTAKTTGLTNAELEGMRNTFENMDTRTSLQGLLGIAEIGGKMGVPKKEILDFTQALDKAAVSMAKDFGGSTEAVASSLGKLKGIFKQTQSLNFGDAMTRIGSAMNALDDAGQASVKNISEFTNRIGQLGPALAPTIQQTMGFAAVLEEASINAEIGAGGLSNILLTASTNSKAFADQLGVTTTEFKKLLNSSPNQMLIRLADSMNGLSGTDIGETMKSLKIGSQEAIKVMSTLASNTDKLREKQKLASTEFAKGTSLSGEFARMNNTLAASFAKTQNRISNLAANVGSTVATYLTPFMSALDSMLEKANTFAKTRLGKVVIGVSLAVGGLLVGMGSLAVAIGTAQLAASKLRIGLLLTSRAMLWSTKVGWKTITMMRTTAVAAFQGALSFGRMAITTISSLIPSLVAGTTGFTVLGVSISAAIWPITLIVAGIAAVIAIIYNWDTIVKWFSGVWQKTITWISEAAANASTWIVDSFWSIIDWFTDAPGTMYNAGVDMIRGLWDGIASLWSSFTSWFSDALASIPGMEMIMGEPELAASGFAGESKPGKFNLNESMRKQAELNAHKVSSTIERTTNNNTVSEPIVINFDLDGERFAKVVDKHNRKDDARR